MGSKNNGEREKYVPPAEFKVGGDPPGGAVRRQRGRGGIPPEVAARTAPRNIGSVSHEPGPPNIVFKISADLGALMAGSGVSRGPSTIPNFKINFDTKVGRVDQAAEPVNVQPRTEPNYGHRFRGVLDQKERIKIWTQIFLEQEEEKEKRRRENK